MTSNDIPIRRDALLLLGPTGVGKTPLGQAMERYGYRGRPCRHFDFGAQLRAAAQSDGRSAGLDPAEYLIVRRVLRERTLLEDHEFHVARKILDRFVQTLPPPPTNVWIVLNGLPRHIGQAEALADRLTVREVLALTAPPDVILERIRRDTGGDRAGRSDDALHDIRKKLRIYAERTEPLIAYYRRRGAHVTLLPVGVETRPADILDACPPSS